MKDNDFDKRLTFQCMWMHDEAMRRSAYDDDCIGGLTGMEMSRVGWLMVFGLFAEIGEE